MESGARVKGSQVIDQIISFHNKGEFTKRKLIIHTQAQLAQSKTEITKNRRQTKNTIFNK